MQEDAYPVNFSVDYPDRPLKRLSTAFRIFIAIPIFILLATISGTEFSTYSEEAGQSAFVAAGGVLIAGPLLMILFRRKYPRWWFDWNLEFLRFSNRVGIFILLMDDRYPSTDEEQSVHLDIPYPNAEQELNRWLPLIKWLLAIPHFLILFVLTIVVLITVFISWFAILFTGRYPRGLFDFAEGYLRWENRVAAYAIILATDKYPPFRFSP